MSGRVQKAALRGRGRPTRGRLARRRRPAVALLEVVCALALFFGVAVVVLGGLSTCVRTVCQVREEAQAADLAVTLLSELQMGLLPVASAGPTAFEDPDADWTWEVAALPVDTPVEGVELARVEIIIRNILDGYTYRLYHWLPEEGEGTGAAPPAPPEEGAGP